MVATKLLLLPILAAGVAAVPHEKRATESGVRLYAYGTGIHGLMVAADSSGLASLATSHVVASQGLTNLTWSIDTTGASAWNASGVTSNATGSFFINTNSYSRAGFSFNGTAPSSASTVGFLIYGSEVMFKSDSTYLSQFWAHNSSTDGLWSLMWNANGSSQDDSVSVVLKTVKPTVLT